MRANYHPTKTTLAVALALGAVAPGAASARLNLNPAPALPAPAPRAVQVIRVAAPAGFARQLAPTMTDTALLAGAL